MKLRKPTTSDKINEIASRIDFHFRESEHILEMVRKHHGELLELEENINDLKAVMRVLFAILIVSIGFGAYFLCK